MAKLRITYDIEYDDGLDGSKDYVLDRIETKLNKVLGEFSKDIFNGGFVVSPVKIKKLEKKGELNADIR